MYCCTKLLLERAERDGETIRRAAHRSGLEIELIARSITFIGCLSLVKSVFDLVCFSNKLCFKVVIYYLCTRVTAVFCLY